MLSEIWTPSPRLRHKSVIIKLLQWQSGLLIKFSTKYPPHLSGYWTSSGHPEWINVRNFVVLNKMSVMEFYEPFFAPLFYLLCEHPKILELHQRVKCFKIRFSYFGFLWIINLLLLLILSNTRDPNLSCSVFDLIRNWRFGDEPVN